MRREKGVISILVVLMLVSIGIIASTVAVNAVPPPTLIIVSVDVKPNSCPNPLNVNSGGVLPVAIVGEAGFDVTQIDPATIRLEGVAPLRWALEDVETPEAATHGPDGYLDLTLKFKKKDVVDALGPVVDGDIIPLTITGNLLPAFGGTPIVGSNNVIIIDNK